MENSKMSNIIDLTAIEVEQLIISTIDKIKQQAIEIRMKEGSRSKDFFDGYILALNTIKHTIS